MRTFMIACDLAELSPNRNALATVIMHLGEAWARPLATIWYVRTSESRKAVEQRLGAHLDPDDGLVIQEVAADAVLLNTALRWFRQRPAAAEPATNVIAFPKSSDMNAAAVAA